MKKTYSKKERESRRMFRNVAIALMVFILLVAVLLVTDSNNGGERQYTAEEMLHDHDGDGIPDH